MRVWIAVFVLFLSSAACYAQHSNNWVQYNQPYYKISVTSTGIFRLTYDQLQLAGVPVNSIDPRLIQVYHRGVEQAILFKHNQQPADNKFDSGEYLEFYGHRNDGELDSKLYMPASVQPHKYYNLFSDTTAYFLTVNPLPVQGKRIGQFDQVNTGLPKETSQINEQLRVYTSEYNIGFTIQQNCIQSYFDEGEGWTGETICTVNGGCIDQRDFILDQLTNVVGSSQPALEVLLTGRIDGGHSAEVYVGPNVSSVRLVASKIFNDYTNALISLPIASTDIGSDGRLIVRVKALGIAGIRDRISVAYIKVRAQQKFDLVSAATKTMELNTNSDPGAKSYIEIDNAPSGTRLWDITDLSNIVQVGTHPSGSLLTAVVPNTNVARKIYASSTFMVPDVSSIKQRTFRDLNTAANYIVVSNKVLTQPGLDYADPVRAFAGYRASAAGGGYDTLTVMIDQLYDQFNYGETSPGAITEFMRYMIGNGNPQYLFLIGKGREIPQNYYRHTPGPAEMKDLVPTAGYPASDMLFTAGLKGDPFVPAIATGRLTANTSTQVAAYLNKVKEVEGEAFDDLWHKQVLHLSGGNDPSEIVRFREYVSGFEKIARGDYYGGNVTTLSKHGFDEIEIINVTTQVNAGLNMITFFGHSAPNITDIDIGFVTDPLLNYNNPGKYPVILLNGCNAGEYFNDGESFGENWVMTPNKGARSFIANSSFGFELPLQDYTKYLYNIGFADSLFITRGIGDVQQEAARQLMAAYGTARSFYTAQVLQMVLLGDPAMKLFGASKPDFQTSSADINVVSSDGKPIHALSDSLEVEIITRNLGRTTKMPLNVKVVHTIGGIETEYEMQYNSVLFEDTLRLAISRGSGNFYGDNKIEVFLDPGNKIDELDESNNTGEWTKLIVFNGTQNLQPANFGIVTTKTIDALFQDTDVLTGEKTYDLQLDTTRLFNSPFLQTKTVTGKILLRSTFTLLDKDSTAYYWRSKPTDKTDEEWETTSFSYIMNGPTGWAQIAFEQLLFDSFDDLVPNENKKRFDYRTTHVDVIVKTFGSNDPEPAITPSVIIDGNEYYYSPAQFSCRPNTINLVAFDKSTVIPYAGIPFSLSEAGGRSCGRDPQIINSFMSNEVATGHSDDMFQYIDNLKKGDSVILFTVGDPDFASYPPTLKTKMEELGISSSAYDNFIPGEPLIILTRKGAAAGTAKIIRSTDANPLEQEISVSEELTGNVTTGSITSVLIGPALKWHSMYERFKEKETTDETGVDVYRVGFDGSETLLLQQQASDISLEGVDASKYPFLKLVYRTTDDDNLTPAQLKNWLVSFDPAPDGLLLPDPSMKPVSVAEGTPYKADFMFVNISNIDFPDSLASSYTLFTESTRKKDTQSFNIKGPAVGDTTKFSRTMGTLGKVGFNDVSAAVNVGFVAEQYLQNNSVELPSYLEVLKDQTNPVLEVTVDGRYLSDGDFVSANPLIRVVLSDNNKLFPLSDTTFLNVTMIYPCNSTKCPNTRINYSRTDVKWRSIDGALVMEFTPKDLQEGTYMLYADGKDATGNPSGAAPYEISFVVDRDPGLIFFDPYPNPSAYGFNFDFDAAGETAPEDLSLSIIDRNGRDIAHFTGDDAPSLRVGMNQLRWTGLDSQGNRISEGLYFYVLVVKTAGREFKNSGRLMIVR
ncbi:MAG: C25 family cysteine peptidase [Bacteroidota bacterium]